MSNQIIPNDLSCNICFGEYNIVKNTLCDCVYYYHPTCFLEWVRRSNNAKCIMCSVAVVVNELVDNPIIYFINIHFGSSIQNPLKEIVSDQVFKYNPSINRKRIENFIFNIDLNCLDINPVDLMVLIRRNVSIPNLPFTYSWNILDNDKELKITLSYVLDIGIIYSTVDHLQRKKTNYIHSISYPGLVYSPPRIIDTFEEPIQEQSIPIELPIGQSYRLEFRNNSSYVHRYLPGLFMIILFIISLVYLIQTIHTKQ